MLAIGFTNKYYTLWDIQVTDNYNQNERGQITMQYTTVAYTYLSNLSIDLTKAQEKAKMRGCQNLEPDNDLYGRNKSWDFTKKEIVKESLENCERDELIMLCCANRTENTTEVRRKAVQVLLDKNLCQKVNNIITVSEHVDKMKQYFQEKQTLLNLEIPKKLTIQGNPTNEGFISSGDFTLKFANLKENYYKGIPYYLPVDKNGKSKRVKNKNIEITEYTIDYSELNEIPYSTWKANDINELFYTEKDSYLYNNKPVVNVIDFKVIT